jgi:hypothetical protein
MKLLLTLFISTLFSLFSMGQELRISMECQETWPTGKPVPVTLVIERGEADGFARFFQNLPQGFSVVSGETGGADFYWDNNQVNMVWLKLPASKVFSVRYFVTPDASLSGSFKLGGRIDYISDGKERHSVEISPVLIRLDRNSVVESVPDIDTSAVIPAQVLPAETQQVVSDDSSVSNEKIEFRVQIAIASVRLTKSELEDRIGCKLTRDLTILKTGNMYKYQSGSYSNYDSASVYLNELKDSGVSDAFIVAFRGDEQIPIEVARTLQR